MDTQMQQFLKIIGAEASKHMRECVFLEEGHIVLKHQSIEIVEKPSFKGLPKDVEVCFGYGDMPALLVESCHNFKKLTHIQTHSNGIRIAHCDQFEQIGPGVRSEGTLELEDLQNFTTFSLALECGDVVVQKTPQLLIIPQLPGVCGGFSFKDCAELESFSEEMREVKGSLSLEACPRFSFTQDALTIHGNFFLKDCAEVTHLPRMLTVEGTLNLDAPNSIHVLPEILKVSGSVSLRGCSDVILPRKVAIGGDVYVQAQSNQQVREQLYVWKEQGMIRGEIILSE